MTEDATPPMSLDAAIESFLTAFRATKPSAHTVRAYRNDLTGIFKLLAQHLDCDTTDLMTTDLAGRNLRSAFAMFADTHAKTSTSRAWSTWNRLCDHLVVDDVIAGNPMAAVGKPKVARAAPQSFSETDISRLLEVLKSGQIPARKPWPIRDYAVITTLAVTGLRASEIIDLTLGDVEGKPGERQIAVRHGKGDKYRAVPVDPRLDALLTTYLEDRWRRFPPTRRKSPSPAVDPWSAAPPKTALFAGSGGEPLTVGQLSYLVTKAYTTAGINSHRPPGALIHALRHTFATRLIENGVSAVELMGLLGHASLQTTQRYVATRPDHLRSAVTANPAYGMI